MSTRYLLAWWLRRLWFSRNDDDGSAPLLRVWHSFAAACRVAFASNNVVLAIPLGDGRVVDLASEHAVIDMAALQADYGVSVCRAWDRSTALYPSHVRGTLPRLTLDSWVLFLELWRREPGRAFKPGWLQPVMSECLNFMAVGLERFVANQDAANPSCRMDLGNALMDLRTRTGRRQGVDPLLVQHVDGAARRVHGSANTVAQVIAGRKTHISQTRAQFVCRTYLDTIQDIVRDSDAICLKWDPATYSGYQRNMELWWCCHENASGILAPKALQSQSVWCGKFFSKQHVLQGFA